MYCDVYMPITCMYTYYTSLFLSPSTEWWRLKIQISCHSASTAPSSCYWVTPLRFTADTFREELLFYLEGPNPATIKVLHLFDLLFINNNFIPLFIINNFIPLLLGAYPVKWITIITVSLVFTDFICTHHPPLGIYVGGPKSRCSSKDINSKQRVNNHWMGRT